MKSLLVCAIVACGVLGGWISSSSQIPLDPAPQPNSNSYIVTLRDSYPEAMSIFSEILLEMSIKPKHNYSIGSFNGFAIEMEPAMALALESHPAVASIDRDVVAYLQTERHDNKCHYLFGCGEVVEGDAYWNLGRVSHRTMESERDYQTYKHYLNGGKDTTVYLLDSGIYVEHSEFESPDFFRRGHVRATNLKSFVDGEPDYDLLGHGTHCAGTIGGKNYGVAKMTEIVGIKVCGQNGQCTVSAIIAGIELAVLDHQARLEADPENYRGSVISMSIGVTSVDSPALVLAANAASFAGVVVVAAAGNAAGDACLTAPASASEVISVGATTYEDAKAGFSNYGKCVNIFAPGYHVVSASLSGRYGRTIGSGTSMACPHVAGLAAYYLSLGDANVTASPQSLREFILEKATVGPLTDIGPGSPNALAFTGAFSESQ